MWLARGGPIGQHVLLYQYKQGRGSKEIEQILTDYHGIIQSDGWQSYDVAQKRLNYTLVACFAHVRRKFDEADKASKKASLAKEMLYKIRKLYTIERELRIKMAEGTLSACEFIDERKKQAQPVLDNIKAWLDAKQDTVLPSSLLGKAISYAQSQWPKLITYTIHENLTPDNNSAVCGIKPFVVGRKNWLFSGCPKGAFAMSTIYSILQTAKENGLNVWDYFNELLTNAPKIPETQWDSLLPFKK
jgi:transposase